MTPIVRPKPPYDPVLDRIDIMAGGHVLAWDQHGQMWVWTAVRRRAYVCPLSFWHTHYWRTHWDRGVHDYVACEHEMKARVESAAIDAIVGKR